MLTALIFALQVHSYQPVLICTVQAKYMRSYARCTVLTDHELTAGFVCESTGTHGETFAGKPFVWSKGQLKWLPLPPEVKYGHVYDGNDELLVGSVDIEYRDRPAVWRPDAQLGWAKPKLQIISMNEGNATCVAPDGSIWVQNESRVVRKFYRGKWEKVDLGSFNLVGVDRRGRIFGNWFEGYYEGMRPAFKEPAVLDAGNWLALKVMVASPDLERTGQITAINSAGLAAGSCQNQAVLWRGPNPELLVKGKRWSYVADINDSGDVIGSWAIADIYGSGSFLWRQGTAYDLAKASSKVRIESPQKLNKHGDIVALAHKGNDARLYLLRP